MLFRHLAVLATILLLTSGAAAQQALPTHTLTGVISDTAGKPLPGATVELTAPSAKGSARIAVTDRTGTYRIDRVVPGLYTLSVRLPGFDPVLGDIEIGGGGEDFRFDVQLKPPLEGAAAPQKPSRRVVCGMTLITPPPNVDPGIQAPKVPPPTGTEGKPTIRAVQPTLCWEPSPERPVATPRLPKR